MGYASEDFCLILEYRQEKFQDCCLFHWIKKMLDIIIVLSTLCIPTFRICIPVELQNLKRFQCDVFFIKNFYQVFSLIFLPVHLCWLLVLLYFNSRMFPHQMFMLIPESNIVTVSSVVTVHHVLSLLCHHSFICNKSSNFHIKWHFQSYYPITFNFIFFRCKQKRRKAMRKKRKQQQVSFLLIV